MPDPVIYPMNPGLPPDGSGGGPYVYVVIQNGICSGVFSTIDGATAERTAIMAKSQGCGPWNPVMDTPDGFLWTGPSGATILCSKVSVGS